MTPLALTAITNFMLACEVFFFAGLLFGGRSDIFSAYGFWALSQFFLGVSALIGGVDHGFFEPMGRDHPARVVFQKLTWSAMGLMTFCILMTLTLQFLPQRYHTIVAVAGILQLAVYCVLMLKTDKFLIVILNYLPVVLLFFILNVAGLGSGTGNWWFIAGFLISFAASVLQMMKVNIFDPLNWNGLYHVMMMAAVVFLYYGGLYLQ